jgi:hypothetical protein
MLPGTFDDVPFDNDNAMDNTSLSMLPGTFAECMEVREISECMHLMMNVTSAGSKFDWDASLTAMNVFAVFTSKYCEFF